MRSVREMRGFLLATARAYEATVWTQDAAFKGLPGVQFRTRKP